MTSNKKIDLRMRIARQGLFSCLPLPYDVDIITGTYFSFLEGDEEDSVSEYQGSVEYREEVKGCIKMWRTVIDRALLYTFAPDARIIDREEAFAWFDLENEETKQHFTDVCEMALLDPKWVSQKAIDIHSRFKENKYLIL